MTLSTQDYLKHTAFVGVTTMLKTELSVSMARHRLNNGTIQRETA